MPSLSHKRLHGRAYMLRALMRAGQFAHLNAWHIERELDGLYSFKERAFYIGMRERDTEPSDLAEAAVPMAFVMAQRGRLLVAPAYHGGATARWLAHQGGALCPLCYAAEFDPHWWYAVTRDCDMTFEMLVSPTALRSEPWVGSMCRDCIDSIWGWVRRRNLREEWASPNGRMVMAGALGWLLTNKGFRDRVAHNAKMRLHDLRFDPRRIPVRQAA